MLGLSITDPTGNVIVLVELATMTYSYMRSASGCGLGSIAVHPNQRFVLDN
jgi:hypothetical protein